MNSFFKYERFFKLIKIDQISGCWNWCGYLNSNGYGKLGIKMKTHYSHRISYFIFKGEIPEGLVVDHKCRNRSCVNPDHLRAVTRRTNTIENSSSMAAIHSRKKECLRGHPLSGTNLRIRKNGSRICIACHQMRNAKRDRRKKIVNN